MDFRTDSRGQSIQVGAVLLFGVAIVLLSTYQATVVPDQNSQTEFQHNQNVHSQLVTIRNTITTPPPRGESQGVQINLGTRYESRTVGVNPRDPAGTIRTVGTDDTDIDVEIQNAKGVQGTPWFWKDTTSFNTGGLVYEPDYNQYQARKVIYDNQALYTGDAESGAGTLADSSLIHGREINLVMLTGSLHRTSSTPETFDIKTVDRSQREIQLTDKDNSQPLSITFHSRQDADYWQDQLLPPNSAAENHKGEYIQDNGISGDGDSNDDGWYEITVDLKEDETYDVTLTKVGIGDDVDDRKEDGTKISMAAADDVYRTQFEDWSDNRRPTTDDCPDYDPTRSSDRRPDPLDGAPVIGGVCEFDGDDSTERTYRLPEGNYEIGVRYDAMLTWDGRYNDEARATWEDSDGTENWVNGQYDVTQDGSVYQHYETFEVDHAGGEGTLEFTANLDEEDTNEAWGIDNVWIRHIED
jgi:hypothetical protein